MTKSTYMLREFKSSSDVDFVKALTIYSRHIHPHLKTNTNEITFWIDHFNENFNDRFFVVGFYVGKELTGYCEFVYVRKRRLIIFDYVVLDEKYRRNNVFFEFIAHLRVFLNGQNLDFDYAVTEVGYLDQRKEPSDYSKLLIRLLQLEGGKVARAPYYQPMLGFENLDSVMPAALLIFANSNIKKISRSGYLSIVECIYYDYYLPWYSIYQERMSEYRAHVDSLFERIKKETTGMKEVKLNGQKEILERSAGPVTKKDKRILVFAVVSLAFVILLAYLMAKLQESFGISLLSLLAIYLISLISFFSIFAVFSKTAMTVFKKLLSLFRPFSRKIK